LEEEEEEVLRVSFPFPKKQPRKIISMAGMSALFPVGLCLLAACSATSVSGSPEELFSRHADQVLRSAAAARAAETTADVPPRTTCFEFIDGTNAIVRAEITSGGADGFKRTAMGSLPLPHSFTWAASLEPTEGVAYAMGGKGTVSRTLYTLNASTGRVLFSPTVGYVYDTAYYLAADLRGNGRLYGCWNLERSQGGSRPAEIDRVKGTVQRYLAPMNWTPGTRVLRVSLPFPIFALCVCVPNCVQFFSRVCFSGCIFPLITSPASCCVRCRR
jgi:hypothetical protein